MKDSELPAIPQTDPRRRFLARRPEIEAAIVRVLDRGIFILGPEVAAFEAEAVAPHTLVAGNPARVRERDIRGYNGQSA